jgi:hypothetical protein
MRIPFAATGRQRISRRWGEWRTGFRHSPRLAWA